jgi:cytochrome c oxidase subunit 2
MDMGKWLFLVASGTLSLLPVAALSYAGQGGGPDDPARGWDHLWHEVLIDISIIGIIFAAATLYFMVKYRRKEPDQEGSPVKLSKSAMLGWALIPAFVFMADDFFLGLKGWELFNDYRTVPKERLEIRLESRMWNWFFTYPNGARTTDELRVPEGKPVLLRMSSGDIVHSLYLPDFRVKEDSMPGRITYLWFYPKKAGEYVFTCAEYCGLLHSNMKGTLKVMPEEEFFAWYEKEKADTEGGS